MNLHAIPAGKLMPPGLSPFTLQRSELCERVVGGDAPLTIVHSAAGFGKTTLLAQCRALLEAEGLSTMWLTIDRGDNDPPRLTSALARALEPVLDGTPEILPSLLDRIALTEGRWILFIDDFEHLQEPGSLALVRELVRRLPRGGRLVVASRNAPDFGQNRIHAGGGVRVLDERDLRFVRTEVVELLRIHGIADLSPQGVAHLCACTEGWATALTLFARAAERGSMSGVSAENLIAGDGNVADYLGEEVLARQPPGLRDFLLRTSVLQTLEPALCQALCPNVEADETLLHLAEARTFISRLEGDVPAWRYHRLFADFLRASLEREAPGLLPRLHLLAAAWYESQGRFAPAVEHALEGEDWPMAARLLELCVEDFLEQGRFRILSRWFDLLPPGSIGQRPSLQMAHLWTVCLTRGAAETRAWIDRYQLGRSPVPRVQAHLRVLELMLLAMEDRYDQANETGELVVAQPSIGDRFVDAMRCNVVAHIRFVLGHDPITDRLIERMQPFGEFGRLYRDAMLGMMELRDGRLRQATARFRMLVEGGAGAQDYAFASAWFGVLYAFTLFESGDLEQADYLLETFLASSRQVGLPDHMIGSYVMRSRIAYARGDVATALELLCELEHDGLQRELKRVAASASLERARIFTLQGQLPAADHALNRAADLISWERVSILSLPAHETDDLVIGRIRLLIAAGKASEASALIAKESMAAATRYRRLMKLELFSVLAQWAAGHASVACSKLRTLLEACSREGYLRLVVDEGAAVVPVLRRFHADIRSGSKSERNPILQDYVERMLGILGALTSSNVADAQGSETLSQKELSVLTLIADGYSNQAISDELEISDSTVRTHLRNINRKLGAQSRTQAVAVARRRMILM